MAKILLINPSKWRRGITPIWIASHSALLKSNTVVPEHRIANCLYGGINIPAVIGKVEQLGANFILKKVVK